MFDQPDLSSEEELDNNDTDKEKQNSFIRAIVAICNDGNSI